MPCGEGRGRRLCQAHDCLGEYKWYLRGLGPEQRRVGGGRLFLVQNNPSTGLCWVWRPSSIRERLSLEGSAGDAFFWSRIQVHIPLQCGDCISAPLRVFIGALKPGGGGAVARPLLWSPVTSRSVPCARKSTQVAPRQGPARFITETIAFPGVSPSLHWGRRAPQDPKSYIQDPESSASHLPSPPPPPRWRSHICVKGWRLSPQHLMLHVLFTYLLCPRP